jgi:protein-tyrosine-phosphatase
MTICRVTEQLSEQAQLALKTCRENLHTDFDELFQAGEVDAVFDDSVGRLQGDNTIDDYIPAIAERLTRERLKVTRERLKGVAQRQGLLTKQMPEVLFVALHDTGRGQMGAALMRSIAGGRISVQSAGTEGGATAVDPGVAEAMREVGIDLSDEHSKPLTPEVLNAADYVVTMGRSTGDVEIPEGVRHIDWRIGDPGGDAPMDEVRHIRDEIKARVERLVDEIAPA